MTTQGSADSETCQCAGQEKITKSGAFPAKGVGWIHMQRDCNKLLSQETLTRLGLV